MDKKDLKTDISCLKENLDNYLSDDQIYNLFDKKEDLKKNLDLEKRVFAAMNKHYKKKNRIKNLIITAKISMFLVPIVIVPGIVGTLVTVDENEDYMKSISPDASYVEECIYLDNFGKEIVLDEERYEKDFLVVETAYEKMDDGSYIGKTYGYNNDVDFFEQMEEKVSTDYVELLNELGTSTSTNTVVRENIDEKDNEPKVSMIAEVYKEVDENLDNEAVITGEELQSIYKREAMDSGLLVGVLSVVAGTAISIMAFLISGEKIDKVFKKKKWEVDSVLPEKKASKKRIKKLEKEIRKLGGK